MVKSFSIAAEEQFDFENAGDFGEEPDEPDQDFGELPQDMGVGAMVPQQGSGPPGGGDDGDSDGDDDEEEAEDDDGEESDDESDTESNVMVVLEPDHVSMTRKIALKYNHSK